jgi:hypothetical protein
MNEKVEKTHFPSKPSALLISRMSSKKSTCHGEKTTADYDADLRIEFVGREVAEIFSVDGERDENQETGEQEFHAAPPSCAFSLVLGWAGRQVGLLDSPMQHRGLGRLNGFLFLPVSWPEWHGPILR